MNIKEIFIKAILLILLALTYTAGLRAHGILLPALSFFVGMSLLFYMFNRKPGSLLVNYSGARKAVGIIAIATLVLIVFLFIV